MGEIDKSTQIDRSKTEEELAHLVLCGSVMYLRDYVLLVSKSLKPGMNALERDRVIMNSLVKEDFVAAYKAEQTLEIILSLHQCYIYEAAFNTIFDYVMEMAG